MIEFRNVTFKRGNRTILRNISFSVKKEERLAILGGSGEGKTTILKLILRLLVPDEGRILIDNEDVTYKKENELSETRRKFSIVFQDGALFDSLNVKENVAFYLREHTKMSEKAIEDRVAKLLEVVGMENTEYLMPEELSGGMLRRVAIARSLSVREPVMFFYDEPTSDLDPASAAKIRQLILSLTKEGQGFIMVTHEIPDALKTAQRFIFLKNGTIRFDGNRNEFLKANNSDLSDFLSHWKE
ncbi:MAG: ABC transporter ATP-binding protein [Chitinispirillaceae bacterium]